jgi:hypothetical protein
LTDGFSSLVSNAKNLIQNINGHQIHHPSCTGINPTNFTVQKSDSEFFSAAQ